MGASFKSPNDNTAAKDHHRAMLQAFSYDEIIIVHHILDGNVFCYRKHTANQDEWKLIV